MAGARHFAAIFGEEWRYFYQYSSLKFDIYVQSAESIGVTEPCLIRPG